MPATAPTLIPAAACAVLSVAVPFCCREGAAGLPQRIKILDWGVNTGRTTGYRILVDEQVAATLSANQELVACDRVPMDYEHQSVPTHPNFQPDPRLSPGAGTIDVVEGEGVYLSAIRYSSNGRTMADSYSDVSAVVHLDKDGRPLWISSVALTQRGDVAGMEFSESVAALSALTSALPILPTNDAHALSALPQFPPNPIPPMDNTPMTDEKTFREILIQFLNLKPSDSGEVTDEEVISAAKEFASSRDAEEKELPEVAALSARMDAMEKTRLIDLACAQGKEIPLSAEAIQGMTVAALSATLQLLPSGEVPMTTSGAKTLPSARVAALNADEARAAKALGLSEHEYRRAL